MIIFDSFQLKSLHCKNRFVRSATCEYMADDGGKPDQRFIELYGQLAAGDIGIIIPGFTYVMPNGKSAAGQTGIHHDGLIPAWKGVVDVVRPGGSLLLMQLVHGGRQVRPKINPGPIWAPSAVPDPVSKTEPLEMTPDQIREVISAFVDGARRAQGAGFHGVQLHAAHGYLLSQFLSPYTNRRRDEYGGTQENRTRIVTDIIRETRKVTGDSFIISAKLNGEDFVDNGLEISGAMESATWMKDAGLDFVEVSGGMAEAKAELGTVRRHIDSIEKEGYFRPHAAAIRGKTGLPTAAVGGFRSLGLMEETLAAGDADFISLCRPFIREPHLVLRFARNASNTNGVNTTERADCTSCNGCFNPRGIRCRQLKR